MASFRSALVSRVEADGGVTAIVGVTGIYPPGVPVTVSAPYIVYQLTAGEAVDHFTGVTQLRSYRVTFDCFGTSMLQAEQIADALRTLFEKTSTTVDSVTFESAHSDFTNDGFDPPVSGQSFGQYYVSIDFEIWATHA
jgi:hypothetical protein